MTAFPRSAPCLPEWRGLPPVPNMREPCEGVKLRRRHLLRAAWLASVAACCGVACLAAPALASATDGSPKRRQRWKRITPTRRPRSHGCELPFDGHHTSDPPRPTHSP